MAKFTLHHGDCLPFLQSLESGSVEAIVTDPPYGINIVNRWGAEKFGYRQYQDDGEWDKQRPDPEIFVQMLRVSKTLIVWGGNYFTDYLPPSGHWLVWDKGQRDFSLADGELAWSSLQKAVRIISYPRALAIKENGKHPTQKPLAVMKWCIAQIGEYPKTILDPFMGSGTTGVACMQMGIDFIGCEISKKYYSIASKRISDAASQEVMFKQNTPNNRLHPDVGDSPAQGILFTPEAGSAAGKSPKPAPRR